MKRFGLVGCGTVFVAVGRTLQSGQKARRPNVLASFLRQCYR